MTIRQGSSGVPISLIEQSQYDDWLNKQSEFVQNWLGNLKLSLPGHAIVPNESGQVGQVVVVSESIDSTWVLSNLANELPMGNYFIEGTEASQKSATLGWLLAQYEFDHYLENKKEFPVLFVESQAVVDESLILAKAVKLTRDLVNTPAGDMMPEHLSLAMSEMSEEFSANYSEVVGDDLLTENFPTIHLVGRASDHAPRLLDMTWGQADHPKLTLVGKGVCFDSGGLDLKPAAGMRLMKKDMGGAAHVLGLARLIMAFQLPVRLRVLIPAVENAVSGNAFRPGDIVKTRKGLTVEIDNTDAEGRLVLCDALALADEESPDMIIDFATLTGAARVALGLEVPGFYTTDDEFGQQLMMSGNETEDAVWQLPLHQAYKSNIKGTISDLVNCGPKPFGGSITAALYLQHFVENAPWVHFDVGAWNDRNRPGRPMGGEAMGIRATFAAIKQKFG